MEEKFLFTGNSKMEKILKWERYFSAFHKILEVLVKNLRSLNPTFNPALPEPPLTHIPSTTSTQF